MSGIYVMGHILRFGNRVCIIRLLAVIFDISLPEQRALHRRKVALETTSIPVIRPAAD